MVGATQFCRHACPCNIEPPGGVHLKSKSKNFSKEEHAEAQLTRRELITTMSSALLFSAIPARAIPAISRDPAPQEASGSSYDLLIKGGKVIDPAQNIETPLDVAIQGGKMARIAEDIFLTWELELTLTPLV